MSSTRINRYWTLYGLRHGRSIRDAEDRYARRYWASQPKGSMPSRKTPASCGRQVCMKTMNMPNKSQYCAECQGSCISRLDMLADSWRGRCSCKWLASVSELTMTEASDLSPTCFLPWGRMKLGLNREICVEVRTEEWNPLERWNFWSTLNLLGDSQGHANCGRPIISIQWSAC